MKLFIVAALLIVAVQGDYVLKTLDDLQTARKECILENKVPQELVAEYQKRIFKEEGVTPCYIRCIFTRLGLFDEKTGFITENYLKQLGRGDTVKDGVVGCYDNTGTDTCLWAYRAFTCFTKQGFLPEGY
ncbi:CLUMA_CG009075, isoform A [Clunio marinus]|uniref:CLUMA_CG009075, isoform A n=1 Tax=Clunio marinus TaxID=568069 RepID=A0A1J1IB01_9DIPT|nr:CLUMA_CG009075, isoform A [Clunio marinus]